MVPKERIDMYHELAEAHGVRKVIEFLLECIETEKRRAAIRQQQEGAGNQ